MSALQELPLDLRKAQINSILGQEDEVFKSEGDRGGKVIAHTATGKPIYAEFNHPAHKGYSKEDKDDVEFVHKMESKAYEWAKKNPKDAERIKRAAKLDR